ncbi:MAG: arsenosugar biosynthesis radical SAM protein ArsS [Saprospiraceae bacterium]|nr:arsenosugar biosynthesis radical SAM protein ArsS [Saprospiraceae bacterium]MBK7737750.1 arsenosugar biosynthesis radical SAM protein ArsS [Saprospiraceae bacterium]MBK7913666.1 arsenosugar biosynthesis radical SAM protein ArsS [Saprospiraceae bacterium]
MKSLKAMHHALADSGYQINLLEHEANLIPFTQKLIESNLYPLRPKNLEIFQINIGKMCNQTCKHCHVDAGPDRKEIMTQSTMEACLKILQANKLFTTVDLTGGAPEMNPHFRWFVEQIKALGIHVMVRCNLTILRANKKYHDLPDFYKSNQVEVISSLPFYSKDRTDKQRGDGVFEDSIAALQMLNNVGYGLPDSGLILNLVYNPSGAFLPADQSILEKEFKQSLQRDFNIVFNQLYTITNMPISRYLDYLLVSGNYENYMNKLIQSYNPVAASNVMCRNTLSIGWDGYIYDCDFNQMLDLKVLGTSQHINDFNAEELLHREIVVNQHCFGCTAGSGSSCGGTLA